MSTTVETTTEIRPFQAEIPQEEIDDLRRRLASTRWPDKETVGDVSQGVQLAKLKELVDYWATGLRLAQGGGEAQRPAAVHHGDRRAGHPLHPRALEARGRPAGDHHPRLAGIDLRAAEDRRAADRPPRRAEDAFHVVIPSLPGYGFSGRPEEPGWNPDRIARAWDELMKRLGYDEYVAQGGDWGAVVTETMGRQAPPGLRAIHVNLPASVPADVEAALNGTGPVPRADRGGARRLRRARGLPQERLPRLLRGADRPPAGGRLRRHRLAGRPRRLVLLAPGLRRAGRSGAIRTTRSRRTRCSTTSRCTG